MIRRWLAPVCALVGMALVVNCAQGGSRLNGVDDDDDPVKPDASTVTPDGSNPNIDAAPGADASPPADAAVTSPDAAPDAPVQQLFCTANNQCTNAGECCLTLGGPQGFCVPGTVIAGVCFPAE